MDVGHGSAADGYLPGASAGPYDRSVDDFNTPVEEPYVVAAGDANLSEPSPLRCEDGSFRLWFGYGSVGTSMGEIWTAEVPGFPLSRSISPERAMVRNQSWEEDWIGSPAVVAQSANQLVMFYQGGRSEPAIGRADSADGGRTWVKHAQNPVLVNGQTPSAVRDVSGSWLLYITRSDIPGIFRGESPDGYRFDVDASPVLEPRKERDRAFDRDLVTSPWVIVTIATTGTVHYSMFFNGIALDSEGERVAAIGWAGSFDGREWVRFANPDEPIVAPSSGRSEFAPAAVVDSDLGWLFFSEQRRGVDAIAVAFGP